MRCGGAGCGETTMRVSVADGLAEEGLTRLSEAAVRL
jgi:hypothetical protein